jgi:hypothetical protein
MLSTNGGRGVFQGCFAELHQKKDTALQDSKQVAG